MITTQKLNEAIAALKKVTVVGCECPDCLDAIYMAVNYNK